MRIKSRIGGLVLGLFLIAMLVMPVAAIPGPANQFRVAGAGGQVPQGLKDDLRGVNME